MADYALTNSATGLIENVVVWDGITTWEPPLGFEAEEIPSGEVVKIGDYYIGGSFTPPATYYSTLSSTLGQLVQVSPSDPQPPDTTDLEPPVLTVPGTTLYWWSNNAPSDRWAASTFNPNVYWDISVASSFLRNQIQITASTALNNQLREYTTVEILNAPDINKLFCADYLVTYGTYKSFIDAKIVEQNAIIDAAVDVEDLFPYNPTSWSTVYPAIASGVIFTGRGAGLGPEDLNVSYYTEFNSDTLTESETELYVPGTDTVISYGSGGVGKFDSFGNCFNVGDYLIQIREVSTSAVIAEFNVPLNNAGENVLF